MKQYFWHTFWRIYSTSTYLRSPIPQVSDRNVAEEIWSFCYLVNPANGLQKRPQKVQGRRHCRHADSCHNSKITTVSLLIIQINSVVHVKNVARLQESKT